MSKGQGHWEQKCKIVVAYLRQNGSIYIKLRPK